MQKDFDTWNKKKKETENIFISKYVHEREIWWCRLGINIGAETDGKSEDFERPVIVMKVYNKETVVVLPITTKAKNDIFHYEIRLRDRNMSVKLTQTRVMSTKRFLRKPYVLDGIQFKELRLKWLGML